MDKLASASNWKQVIGTTEDDDYREDGQGRADYVDAIVVRLRAGSAESGACQDD